jgi:hypothetical protein
MYFIKLIISVDIEEECLNGGNIICCPSNLNRENYFEK